MAKRIAEFGTIKLTQFSAGREGIKIQINGENDHGPTHIVIDRIDAQRLAHALDDWCAERRADKET